jgi:hypothetical protein
MASRNEPSEAEDGSRRLTEDEVKIRLLDWLRHKEWNPVPQMGKKRGIDIDAQRGDEHWVIEVKGCGSRPQMRVNYFLAVLAELLQRMKTGNARYSVAFPDHPQFKKLWNGLPPLAKSRTGIGALFVRADGSVEESD